LAPTPDRQFLLYGMAWMWMNLSKYAERIEAEGTITLHHVAPAKF